MVKRSLEKTNEAMRAMRAMRAAAEDCRARLIAMTCPCKP